MNLNEMHISDTSNQTQKKDFIILFVVASLLYVPYLGGVNLFDWDEINFAEMAREMILMKDYLHLHINFQPFYEKPPLFIWFQVIAMKLFGVNEFAARFPNAICGIVTHMVVYSIGTKVYSRRLGWIWTAVYAGSILPHWYFKSGIIDPWFNLFIFLSIYFMIKYVWQKKYKTTDNKPNIYALLLLAGLFLGFALLTKGPAAYIIICIVLFAYWVTQKFRFFISPLHFILYTLFGAGVFMIWIGIDASMNGTQFIEAFMIRNYELFVQPDAGHKGFTGYHIVVFIVGCFPASIFAIRAMYNMKPQDALQADFRRWMIILFWVVLILFSIVSTKIIHYSSLTYFPVTFLCALCINAILSKKVTISAWMLYSIIILASVIAIILLVVPFLQRFQSDIIPLINDPFAVENIKAQVSWKGLESLVGLAFVIFVGLGIYKIYHKKYWSGLSYLFFTTAITVQLIMYVFLNKIETHSQRAAIDFVKALKGKDCYVENVGYKSYAQLFYFAKPLPTNPNAFDDQWLYTGAIDKDVYIITKINKLTQTKETIPEAQILASKNGFVFLKRNK